MWRLNYRLLLVCFCVCLSGRVWLVAEPLYQISETQLRSIETSLERLETDRLSWESQARGLRSEAVHLNEQLQMERAQYRTLEQSFDKLENSRLTEIAEQSRAITELETKNKSLVRAVVILGSIIGLVIISVVAFLVIKLKFGVASFFKR